MLPKWKLVFGSWLVVASLFLSINQVLAVGEFEDGGGATTPQPPTINCTQGATPENDVCKIGTSRYCAGDKTLACSTGSCSSSNKCDFSNCAEVSGNPLGCKSGVATAGAVGVGNSGGVGGQTGQPEDVSNKNWDAFKQITFTFNGIISAFSCLSINIPFGGTGCPAPVFNGTDFSTKIFFKAEGGGALGTTSYVIAQMYDHQPASGTEYLANAIRDGIRIVQPAYAQVGGSGNAAISPVYNLWRAMRDITYLLFVIIFIVVGFMIMFKQKLGQGIVTVQAAIPGLIIALVFITFSYFIAGLIVDMAYYLSQFIGVLFLTQLGGSTASTAIQQTQEMLNKKTVINFFTDFAFSPQLGTQATNLGGSLGSIIQNGNRGLLTLIGILGACLSPVGLGAIATTGLVGLGGCALIGAGAGAVGVGPIMSGLAYFVLLFAILAAMFRLTIALVSTYVGIVVAVIIGPLSILISAIPGQGGSFTTWWRGLLGNVLVFPAVYAAILFAAALLGLDTYHMNNPIIGIGQFDQALPLFGGAQVGFINALLAFGVIIATPAIPDYIRGLMKVQQNPLGQAAAQGIRGAIPIGTQAGTAVAQGARGIGRRVVRVFRP